MKRELKACLMFSLLTLPALFAGNLWAQEASNDSVSMDLDKVLEVALSDNPDIQVANRTIEIQKYAKKETMTGLFPTVDFSLAETWGVIIPEANLGGMKIKMGKDQSYTWSGTATLPLVVPQLWESLKISQRSVELSVEQARNSKISTLSAVKKAFFQLLLARDSYEVLKNSYNLAEENLAVTRDKYKLGLVAEYDTLTAYVQKVSIEPNMLSMKNTLALAEMQLKVLMGVNVSEPIRFEGHLKDYEEKLFSDLMILKEDNDISSNSALVQIDIQKQQLVLSERLNKLGYLPTIALQYSMNRSYSGFLGYATTANLTLALNWTIFDGLSKYMKTKQNKLNIENLEQQREYTKQQLEMSISSSLNTIETAAEQVVAYKSSIYSAERAYEINAKRYEIGSGIMLELNSSANVLQQNQLSYVQAIYDFVSAQATLEETLGKIITDK
ncbi:MAG: TolC family protein [Bacteroidales bacterium]|nr:TolC family protein [Bacteroidales bacterium]